MPDRNRAARRADKLARRAAQPGGPRRAERFAARMGERATAYHERRAETDPRPRCDRNADAAAARFRDKLARATAYYEDRTAAAYLHDAAACTPPRDRAARAATISAGTDRRIASARARLHRAARCPGPWGDI